MEWDWEMITDKIIRQWCDESGTDPDTVTDPKLDRAEPELGIWTVGFKVMGVQFFVKSIPVDGENKLIQL